MKEHSRRLISIARKDRVKLSICTFHHEKQVANEYMQAHTHKAKIVQTKSTTGEQEKARERKREKESVPSTNQIPQIIANKSLISCTQQTQQIMANKSPILQAPDSTIRTLV